MSPNGETDVTPGLVEKIEKRSTMSSSMLLCSALRDSAKSNGSFTDSYDIIDEQPFARGAFALVWRCRLRKATSNMIYVAKRIERAHLQKVDKRNLFGSDGRDGEIRLHSKIIHPSVVRLISVFEEPDVVSVVLESCPGGDLFEHIRAHKRATGGGVSAPAASTCMRQLLGALTFLHTTSIVHRDVKCENVMLVEEGLPLEQSTCKLGDFGFAVCLHQVKGGRLYTIMGSPSTVAPEVLHKKAYGTPADLWSAGVVLYNLLAATQPFEASTPRDIMRKVKAGDFSFEGAALQKADEEAKDLLKALMCVRVEARLRAPQALLHSFLRKREVAASSSTSDLSRDNSGCLNNKARNLPSSICTTDSLSPCDTDFGAFDRQYMESQHTSSARSSRLPSIATDSTEPSVPDSEFGLSEWQITYARRMTPVLNARSAPPGQDFAATSSRNSPTEGHYILPHCATRHSRLTSNASDTTANDSAFGLGDRGLEEMLSAHRLSPDLPTFPDAASAKEAQKAQRRSEKKKNLDRELLAKHTALAEMNDQQAALDVLALRLQDATNDHDKSPHRFSECRSESNISETDGVPLDPFIYKKRSNSRQRRIADVYKNQIFGHQDPNARPRGCCGCGDYDVENRPWWHRWFL